MSVRDKSTSFFARLKNVALAGGNRLRRFVVGSLHDIARDPSSIDYDLSALANSAVERRRAALAASGRAPVDSLPSGQLGLAFSGGGIRSATISLGVAQALAKHDRLLDFDYLSTVSGGGYFGSFLVSLFAPDSARGPGGKIGTVPDVQALIDRRQLAERALTLSANQTELNASVDVADIIRSPVWWLRENGRYLAPNGPTDYVTAISYMTRNWLAMMYVFILPVAVASTAAACGYGVVLKYCGWLASRLCIPSSSTAPPSSCAGTKRGCTTAISSVSENCTHVSPTILFVILFLFLSLATGIAYWLTEKPPLTSNARGSSSWLTRWAPKLSLGLNLSVSAAAIATLWKSGVLAGRTSFSLLLTAGTLLVGSALGVGMLAALVTGGSRGTSFTTDMRRRLTRWTSLANIGLLIAVGVAVVDTLALNAYGYLVSTGSRHLYSSIATGIVVPLGALIINKLPSLFKPGAGMVSQLLAKYLWTIALFCSVALYGALCIAVDISVQAVAWNGGSLGLSLAASNWSPHNLHVLGGIALFLLLITGTFTGFINLSSLHNFYTARLTRAYLGGTNLNRLRQQRTDTTKSVAIGDNDSNDDFDVAVYQGQASAAPIHLINVTLNETRNRDGSQLVQRDRKGLPVVFAPEGVFVDAARGNFLPKPAGAYYYPWSIMADHNVEALSVGQLCAISGAAASPGMGARTTIGGSLLFTFANIRLGYWWNVSSLIRRNPDIAQSVRHWAYVRITRVLRTYFYLTNEMFGRYSRDYARLNISDGGHFDNSGVYELLRRGVPTIVVCDNSADPDFDFEDLENIIRKGRIDLGLSISVASAAHVRRKFGQKGRALFLNGQDGDWRARARKQSPRAKGPVADEVRDEAFALLLVAHSDDETAASGAGGSIVKHHILWMKPRLFNGLPQDVVGYALTHRTFPHESTGNQFFNEAQWESYRALGYSMVQSLFESSRSKVDCFRKL